MNAHDLLTNSISVAYSQILMSAPGDLAVSNLRAAQGGEFILVVEGAIPTAFNGMTCTVFTENGVDVSMKQIVSELAPRAKVVICVGTCSSFGGIPAAAPNPTGITTVKALTGVSTINIPGCPAHPDWIAGTLATLLCGGTLATDSDGRPSALFSETVHDHCPKKALYTMLARARNFGVEGFCLYHLGCKGRETKADCPVRGWNNGFNYCVSSNGSCIGCVESTFPINPMIKR
jgi:hydrogenase small subunit